jgi:hypothetical protein
MSSVRQRLTAFVGATICCGLGLLTSIWGWIPQLVEVTTAQFLALTGAIAILLAWQFSDGS